MVVSCVQRDAAIRKPARDKSEDRDEQQSISEPDQDPGQHGLGEAGGVGQHELPGRQECSADDEHEARAEPVDK
jgi:hypothetical protein